MLVFWPLSVSWQFTWPEYSVSDEVHMDDFWLTMETEAIEQAIFPTDIPITRVDASIIAPFFPPLMRGPTVINTEKDKVQSPSPRPSGTKVLFDWKPGVTFHCKHQSHFLYFGSEDLYFCL